MSGGFSRVEHVERGEVVGVGGEELEGELERESWSWRVGGGELELERWRGELGKVWILTQRHTLSILKPYTNFEEIVLVKIGFADFCPIHKIGTRINYICPSSKKCISLAKIWPPFQTWHVSIHR